MGGYSQELYVASFAGFVPVDKPRVVIAVPLMSQLKFTPAEKLLRRSFLRLRLPRCCSLVLPGP